jgi:hypothetical protein
MRTETPIFMTGTFRSGSAMVSRILNAHSKIVMANDKFKFFRFAFGRYEPLNEMNTQKMISDMNDRVFARWSLTIDIDSCMKEVKAEGISYKTIYKTMMRSLYDDYETPIIGELEGSVWRNIPDFFEMYPEGKAIMLIRDIRDVVVSFKKMTFAPGDDYLVALFNVIDAMDHWTRFSKEYPDQFYGIRYEQIKLDPEPEVRKICKFLRIEYEPAMIDESKWTDLGKGRWGEWENRAVSSFHKEGDSDHPVGRWRRKITPEDHFLCEWLARKQMSDFELEPEGQHFDNQVLRNAMQQLHSSELLLDCYRTWIETGSGVTRFPLDPLKPENWNKRYLDNPEVFKKK